MHGRERKVSKKKSGREEEIQRATTINANDQI